MSTLYVNGYRCSILREPIHGRDRIALLECGEPFIIIETQDVPDDDKTVWALILSPKGIGWTIFAQNIDRVLVP